jgi:hypothetical protein
VLELVAAEAFSELSIDPALVELPEADPVPSAGRRRDRDPAFRAREPFPPARPPARGLPERWRPSPRPEQLGISASKARALLRLERAGEACPDLREAYRVALCAFHHQRALHAGLLRIRGRAPDALLFELGLRPGAAPLARYRSGDIEIAAP